MENKPTTSRYAEAGVDIDAKDRALELIAKLAGTTSRPEVLSGVGFFGGMFDFKDDKGTVLVSSIDQVGTKTKIANAVGRFDTVGIDIVNHCVNDIFTCGAEPLFFLDYIGMARLVPEKVGLLVQGLAAACREVSCALIGGETGEMAGLYAGPDDFDLVGFIIGVVAREKIITGQAIIKGDTLLGLPSSGLHTNGYSLVRRIFGETKSDMETRYPELGRTLGEELLEPHRCYYSQLKPLLPYIKGLAHITGGGFMENIPRILPAGITAQVHRGRWTIPPVFQLIQQRGKVDQAEMFRVFNMGIGMVVVCSPENTERLTKALPEAKVLGEAIEQRGKERVIIK